MKLGFVHPSEAFADARLLGLYPRAHRERFAEPMLQTFEDILRAQKTDRGLLSLAFWMFAETSVHATKEMLIMQRAKLIRILVVTAAILAIPLVAMQFDSGVNWAPGDFLIAGALIIATGLGYEFVASRLAGAPKGNAAYRAGTAVAAVGALALVWINLAVGIIGNEGNAANLMYAGVLMVGLGDAVLAGLRPAGMERALWSTAAAQGLVTLVTVVLISSSMFTLLLNAAFVGVWIGAALLFRHSTAALTLSEE